MSDSQGWVMLGLVGVLLSTIGGLVVQQIRLVREALDARITGLGERVDTRFDTVDARFDAVNHRLDSLDRDVQVLMEDRFRRDD